MLLSSPRSYLPRSHAASRCTPISLRPPIIHSVTSLRGARRQWTRLHAATTTEDWLPEEARATPNDDDRISATDLSTRLRCYQQRLKKGDVVLQQLALEEMMELAAANQLPFKHVVEVELLDDLIQQLEGPLAIMSLAAEVLCRLITPAAVEEFHLLLQPCIPVLVGIIGSHNQPTAEEIPAVFFALNMLTRLCASATLASMAIKHGCVQALVDILDVAPATVCQATVYALYRLVQQPHGACQPALTRAAHAGAFRRLIKVLQHADGSTGQMAWHIMCEMSQVEEARQAIAGQYGVQQLVQLLKGSNQDVAIKAMLVLGRLCSRQADWQVAAVKDGALEALLKLAPQCNDEQCAHVWRTIAVLIQHTSTHATVMDCGAIRPLVACLQDDECSEACQEQALSALALMAQNPGLHGHLVAWGLLPALVPMLTQQHPTLQLYALMLTMMLTSHEQRHAALVASSGALPALVSIMRQGGGGNKPPYAVHTLANLASDSDLQGEIVAAGAIPACIRLLEHSNQECCCHAAEVLLHLASSTAVRRRLIARAGALEPLYALLLSTSPPVQIAAAHLLQVLCQELCVAEEVVGSDSALLNVSLLLASSRHQDFAAGDLQPAKAYAAWLVAGLATDDYYREQLKQHELVPALVRMLGIKSRKLPASMLVAGMQVNCHAAATAALLTMARLDKQLSEQVLQQLALQAWLGNNITVPGLVVTH